MWNRTKTETRRLSKSNVVQVGLHKRGSRSYPSRCNQMGISHMLSVRAGQFVFVKKEGKPER